MRKLVVSSVSSLLAILMIATAVFAAATFDLATGTGFVGKGDVQQIYTWNNKELNANANNVQFRYSSVEVTEVSWECTNSNNQKVQERERTTTSSIQGVVTHIARDNKKQITGFNLTDYSASGSDSSTSEGPVVNNCQNAWTLTSPAGEPEVKSSTGGLQVSINGTTWSDVPTAP
jgi:hypothetical protein